MQVSVLVRNDANKGLNLEDVYRDHECDFEAQTVKASEATKFQKMKAFLIKAQVM